jgi:hypothetical protein
VPVYFWFEWFLIYIDKNLMFYFYLLFTIDIMAQKEILNGYKQCINRHEKRVATIFAVKRSLIPDRIEMIRQSTEVQTATKEELDAAGKACGVCCAERILLEKSVGAGQGYGKFECAICRWICCDLCSRDEDSVPSSIKRICHSKACLLTHQYQQGLMSAEELTTTTDRVSRELICQWLVFQSKMEKCLGYRRALLLYDAERVVKMTP